MDDKTTMYEFCERKQQAFNDACCQFAVDENMEDIARKLDLPKLTPSMLRNKLNPEQPHVLKPVELIAISKVSQNYTLINCLIMGCDLVVAPVDKDAMEVDLLTRLLHVNKHAGELSSCALEINSARALTRTHRQSIIQKAQVSIGNLVLLINDVENRSSGIQPLLQMGLDFITNGAPLPGVA